jgi:hypothetical protein
MKFWIVNCTDERQLLLSIAQPSGILSVAISSTKHSSAKYIDKLDSSGTKCSLSPSTIVSAYISTKPSIRLLALSKPNYLFPNSHKNPYCI